MYLNSTDKLLGLVGGFKMYSEKLAPLSEIPLSSIFIGLYLCDEATQTTQTNFFEFSLNPSTSPRSLLVEFKYTLYIYKCAT
jgi:hypothetical protein